MKHASKPFEPEPCAFGGSQLCVLASFERWGRFLLLRFGVRAMEAEYKQGGSGRALAHDTRGLRV